MFFPTEAKSDFFLQKEKWESLCESFSCFGQKNIVLKILFGFLWSFSVSMFWKRKKFTVPIQLLPHSDTSAYPLHTWNVLLNLTVHLKAIEQNCFKQSLSFLEELLEILRLNFFWENNVSKWKLPNRGWWKCRKINPITEQFWIKK